MRRRTGVEGEAANVVAVVEGDGAGALQGEHGVDVDDHGCGGAADVFFGIALAEFRGLTQREALRNVAVERIVGAGLVGDNVDLHAAADDFGEHVGAVADEANGECAAFATGQLAERERLVEILGQRVAIARFNAALDAAAVDLDGENHSAVEGDGERLRAAHAAHAAGDDELALQGPAEVSLGQRGEGLEGALQNSLRPDVDPGAGGHLAVHHEALAVELVEVLPCGPFAHQIGVGDDDARRHVVGGKDGDGLAGLDEERLFVAEALELADDGVEALPVARGLADAAVDDEVLGPLGNFGVEIVHEAAEGGFLLPALAAKGVTAGGANDGG